MDNCYKFVTAPTTWSDARNDCQQETNADLAIINNVEEQQFIEMAGQLTGDWWIGELCIK